MRPFAASRPGPAHRGRAGARGGSRQGSRAEPCGASAAPARAGSPRPAGHAGARRRAVLGASRPGGEEWSYRAGTDPDGRLAAARDYLRERRGGCGRRSRPGEAQAQRGGPNAQRRRSGAPRCRAGQRLASRCFARACRVLRAARRRPGAGRDEPGPRPQAPQPQPPPRAQAAPRSVLPPAEPARVRPPAREPA